MLNYFLQNKDIKQIENICEYLNLTKDNLLNSNSEIIKEYFEKCFPFFLQIKDIALQRNDEKLANSQFVFQKYFLLFYNLNKFFVLLKNKKYKASWDKLQDCLDDVKFVCRFSEHNKLELEEIYELLMQYESLYPYKVFTSSEYVISKSHCSICGKSMQNLDCPHIKGNLYWGDLARECVDKIDVLQAVCIVSNPEDKRCVLELKDDEISEEEKFFRLNEYLRLNQPLLQKFEIEEHKELRRKDVKKQERNEQCFCGSGKKFKHCCGKNLYYEHIKYLVKPLSVIELVSL